MSCVWPERKTKRTACKTRLMPFLEWILIASLVADDLLRASECLVQHEARGRNKRVTEKAPG